MPDLPGAPPARIVLGTMRLHESGRSAEEWADFFLAAHDLGVTTLHSSTEYESFLLFRAILERLAARAPQARFRHMVKLGAPHFDEDAFDADRLHARVEDYRTRLGADCIADVQWMWRHGVQDDASRIERFLAAAPDIARAAQTLKDKGWIERLLCFPYTPAFAAAAVDCRAIDGLAVYRNTEETGYDAAIDRAGALGKACVVIRPFFGGKLLEHGADAVALLRFALDKPAIESAVVSCSKLDRLEALIGGVA